MSSSSGAPLKVIACGDVTGRFSAWLKRLDSVCKKAGPFDMALCVGSFYSPSDDCAEEDRAVLDAVKAGKRALPLPVYILGPNSQAEVGQYGDLGGYEICENLVYLGRHGCYTTREGLRIAYMSGGKENAGAADGSSVNDPFSFNYAQFKELQVQLKWDDPSYQGVDVLLTSQWPRGVSNNTSSKPESVQEDQTSKLVSRLAYLAKPRYHFAGIFGSHYERRPYRNHMVLTENVRHVTRFLGLAKVANPKKLKWLFAFNIVPAKTMDRGELLAQPPDATDCPYTAADVAASTGPTDDRTAQFFYDMDATPEERGGRNQRKRGGGGRRNRDDDDGQQYHKRPRQPTGPCWFCLSGSEVEKHLVVSVGDHAYLALPKGGLTPEHVLILPIGHYPSSLEIPEDVEKEISKFKSAIKKCFKKQGKIIVFFERNYKSQHLQLQAVPLPKECAPSVKSVYLDTAESQQIEFAEMPAEATLAQMVEPGSPYFYAELPTADGGKDRLFHRVRRGFPIQFGREALASRSLLNVENRVDWRECKVSQEEEADMTKRFRKLFEPFDFTLEDEDAV